MPRMRLDHIIKERYPTFVDALRDLDDALTLLFLFANLPSTPSVPPNIIARCQRLTLEFEHYIIRTASLRKSFLSIKGIYYQATIQGQDVLWLVPYRFVQRGGAEGGGEVDYRIMATFVEFYAALLGFVNFRLYTGIGLVYPPKLEKEKEDMGAELGALKLESKGEDGSVEAITNGDGDSSGRAQKEADRLLTASAEEEQQAEKAAAEDEEEPSTATALDTFAPIDSTADTLDQPSLTSDPNTASKLFEPFTFFLSRETPRHPLEFVLRAFGCKRIAWSSSIDEAGLSGSYCTEDDERITHQVVDRPDLPLPSPPQTDDEELDEDGDAMVVRKTNERVPGRVYIQPQWIWDCVNAGHLLRTDLYAPGATLPPHLSPFVKPKKGEYDPTKSVEEQDGFDEADVDEDESDQEDGIEEASEGEEVAGVRGDVEARILEEEMDVEGNEVEDDGGMDVQLGASDDEGEESADELAANDDWDGFSGDEDEADLDTNIANDASRQAQAELEAEALGMPPPSERSARAREKAAKEALRKRKRSDAAEAKEDLRMKKGMMSNKQRKLLDKIEISKDTEAGRLNTLVTKKRKADKEAQKSKSQVRTNSKP